MGDGEAVQRGDGLLKWAEDGGGGETLLGVTGRW